MSTGTSSHGSDRPVRQSMLSGFRNRCPHCNQGKLFGRFLKPVAQCDHCGEAYDGLHRADDFPAYVVIFIVGHLVVPMFLFADRDVHWPMWVHMVLWPSLVLVLALALLQPVKGALIALQWAKRMHGFDPLGDIHDAPMVTADKIAVKPAL
jgi:uncharacterized protein (DUF983 family)